MIYSLEAKVEESSRQEVRPDKRQWIPIYGFFQIDDDLVNNRPVILNGKNYAHDLLIAAYHLIPMAAIFSSLIYGCEYLCQKF